MIRTILADRNFDWENIIYQLMGERQNDNRATKKTFSDEMPNRILPITMNMISKLGIRVLPDRRLCFAGKALKGIHLPNNLSLQIDLIKRFLVWYSPCIELRGGLYKMNNECFFAREILFLKMYLRALGYQHYLWNPLLPGHSYNHL